MTSTDYMFVCEWVNIRFTYSEGYTLAIVVRYAINTSRIITLICMISLIIPSLIRITKCPTISVVVLVLGVEGGGEIKGEAGESTALFLHFSKFPK